MRTPATAPDCRPAATRPVGRQSCRGASPDRRVDAGHGPSQVRSRKLVFAFGHEVEDIVEIVESAIQHPWRDLSMKNLNRDVGVVGRDLTPAFNAAIGGHAHETDPLVRESLDRRQLHRLLPFDARSDAGTLMLPSANTWRSWWPADACRSTPQKVEDCSTVTIDRGRQALRNRGPYPRCRRSR